MGLSHRNRSQLFLRKTGGWILEEMMIFDLINRKIKLYSSVRAVQHLRRLELTALRTCLLYNSVPAVGCCARITEVQQGQVQSCKIASIRKKG